MGVAGAAGVRTGGVRVDRAPCAHRWSLPDPSKAEGSEEERLEVYRRVRDRVRANVEGLVEDGAR